MGKTERTQDPKRYEAVVKGGFYGPEDGYGGYGVLVERTNGEAVRWEDFAAYRDAHHPAKREDVEALIEAAENLNCAHSYECDWRLGGECDCCWPDFRAALARVKESSDG